MADHPILQAMRRASGLPDTLARAIGACRLTCSECSRTETPTPEEVARYFAAGWPVCHGATMTMEKIRPKDTAPSGNGGET